jgi:hypothetical protein
MLCYSRPRCVCVEIVVGGHFVVETCISRTRLVNVGIVVLYSSDLLAANLMSSDQTKPYMSSSE